jgi:hypothetical protein
VVSPCLVCFDIKYIVVFQGRGIECVTGEKKEFPAFFNRAALCGITPSLFVGCMPGGWGVEISMHGQIMTIS